MIEPGSEPTPRGRYAPSPTGELHLGNASSALLAWLSVRCRQGSFVMRMEDLDPGRSREELADQVLSDVRWLGLDWDEGPDVGGPHEPYTQSLRSARYDRAFGNLQAAGRIYPCFCSRKDIAAAASAPHGLGGEIRYPGTCRALDPAEAEARLGAGERHAWRFRVPSGAHPRFHDLFHGDCGADLPTPGDFVVRRSDGVTAYQLAVVVDDAEMGINEVVRGDDLLSSTPQQILLASALDLAVPVYGHVPLLMGTDRARLSKRHHGITLRELREAGHSPSGVVGKLARLLALTPDARPLLPDELLGTFSHRRLPVRPEGIEVDVGSWRPTN